MSYPITVTQQSLNHKGGTKSYHFTLISNAAGKSVLVFRYGKTGQFGQLVVGQYETVQAAENVWAKKEREKSGSAGGYSPTGGRTVKTANSSSELKDAMGLALLNKVGASAVKHIDPSYNTSGMRDTDPATVDEDGRSNGDVSRKADVRALMEKQREEDAKRTAEAYANNENFGIF